MGLLDDILAGQSGGASPFGALYQNPDPAIADDLAKKQAEAAKAQMAAAMMSGNPMADPGVAAPSPFGEVPTIAPQAPAPPVNPFGAVPQNVQGATAAPPTATPFSFAGPGSNVIPPQGLPQQPALPAPAAPAPSAAPAPPAAAPQAAPLPIGGYQMPRVGGGFPAPGADDGEEDTPANATPTSGTGAPGPASAPFSMAGPAQAPSPGVGDRLGASLQSFAAPQKGGLFGRLASGVSGLVSGQRGDPTGVNLQLQGQADTANARALLAKNVNPEVVQAAVLASRAGQPDLLKSLITQNFGPDKFQHVERKDALGGTTIGAFDPSTGKTTFEGGGAGGAQGPAFGALMAPGVTYDPNKSGDEYMAQFGPEVQSAAKAYINGDVMPTGNARNQSIATFAKTVAQKWGQDTGNPVNDSTYSGKRKMQTDLASSGNSSMGGILSNGESSFSHLAEATGSMADLGNASHDFWGGGIAAHLQNAAGNAMGGSNVKAKIGAIIDNLGKYGAESTKFYAGTGGGVEERTSARKDVDPNSVSGEEMAAYAQKEKSLMLDRLNTKFQQIRDVYGEDQGNAIIAKHMPQIQKNIATIDANVARMNGNAPAASAGGAAPSTVPPPGKYVWTPGGGLVGGK